MGTINAERFKPEQTPEMICSLAMAAFLGHMSRTVCDYAFSDIVDECRGRYHECVWVRGDDCERVDPATGLIVSTWPAILTRTPDGGTETKRGACNNEP